MKVIWKQFFVILFVISIFNVNKVNGESNELFWIKFKPLEWKERNEVANSGLSIENVQDNQILAIGRYEFFEEFEKRGWVETHSKLNPLLDFPSVDQEYHNLSELEERLRNLNQTYPEITELKSIGKSAEGRELYLMRISTDLTHSSSKPAVFFVGGHHAREHLSVEVPLLILEYLLSEYRKGNERIVNLIQTREIHILPALNVDGLEFDIAKGEYQYWRKNRRNNNDRTFGVDLNRNYGFKWGTGGSSNRPSSDVYMGPKAFSEQETLAVKSYLESHVNITMLLSFHTFSELILYPWGHTEASISDQRDFLVHKSFAEKMATWNNYTPEQASSLYIASGDLTDWSFGQLKIISFTFELDPKGGFMDGFYPGVELIPKVVKKNIEPCLFMLEYADNPYRILDKSLSSF